MKNIISCIGVLLLLVSCNQEIDSKKDNEEEEVINNTIANTTEEKNASGKSGGQETEADILKLDLGETYEVALNQLKADYQKRLDTGIGMLQASKVYNKLTDSIVTLVYSDLLEKTTERNKESLMLEQKEWLKIREEKFDVEYKKGEAIYDETGVFPALEEMVAYGVAADLNYERVMSLIKKENNVNEVATGRLAGKHSLTIQWIGWDNPGEIAFNPIGNEEYKVEGLQKGIQSSECPNCYLKVEGTIVEITPKKLRFTGVIESSIHYIQGGDPCIKEGTFDFVSTGDRKYWRCRNMAGCDGVTDYVDIYF